MHTIFSHQVLILFVMYRARQEIYLDCDAKISSMIGMK